MRILALNAYHGGSHRAFLNGWAAHSRHQFTVLKLPAYKWKWRMRHAAITFAEQTAEAASRGETWDALFCTDMFNLAEFRGLATALNCVPAIAYFHENQLTYPAARNDERDLHFAFTNMITALAADVVWFNSSYHRDEFLGALAELINRMPDYQPRQVPTLLRIKSEIHAPGIDTPQRRPPRGAGPLRILWSSRWEHDKDPATFFAALDQLQRVGCDFRLSVLGEAFQQSPDCFQAAHERFAERIEHWGCLPRREYLEVLARSDVVVSTARHEFFGIAVVEAVAAGCQPLVPRRLAYPEVLGDNADLYHDGSVGDLANRLVELANRIESGGRLMPRGLAAEMVETYAWQRRSAEMDAALDRLVEHRQL